MPLQLEDGRIAIPVTPGRTAILVIRSARGVPISTKVIDLSPRTRRAKSIVLLAPVMFTVAVMEAKAEGQDHKQAVPIAGAEVRVGSTVLVKQFRQGSKGNIVLAGLQLPSLGKTGPDGTLKVRVPATSFLAALPFLGAGIAVRDQLLFFAAAPGYRTGRVNVKSNAKLNKVELPLQAGYSVQGRIMTSKGKPAVGFSILSETTGSFSTQERAWTSFPVSPTLVKMGKNGRFKIHGFNRQHGYLISAVLSAKLQKELGLVQQDQPVAAEAVVIALGPVGAKGDEVLGDIVLDQLTTVTVHVRAADGRAIPGSVVYAIPNKAITSTYSSPRLMPFTCDRRGRGHFLLPSRDYQLIVTTRNHRYAILDLQVEDLDKPILPKLLARFIHQIANSA